MNNSIEELYKLQSELDSAISSKFVNHINQDKILSLKIVSLYVEIGELANETRCFKYWSVSQVYKSRNSVLEEYADGLHFLLSIGNHLKQNNFEDYNDIFTKYYMGKPIDNLELADQFLSFFESLAMLKSASTNKKNIHAKLMKQYLKLGASLGFTYQEIWDSYLSKNKINHQRIQDNY